MSELLIGVITALVPTVIGWISSIAVIKTQINDLIKKVDKHNTVIERTYKLEQRMDDLDKELKR